MADNIRVSFRNNDFDNKLYDEIMEECKVVGQSAWMKQAAYEKLQRDKGSNSNSNSNKANYNQSNQVIKSLDQLFKK